VTWVAQIGSTQIELVERARAGGDPAALATTAQTSGHGRRGRGWVCPPGGGLALSVLLRPDRGEGWGWLPLLTGVAVVETLRATGVVDASLKWPNDVLDHRGKLAGLLADRVETGHGQGDRPAVVIGIGVNLDSAGLPDGSSALEEHPVDVSPRVLADRLLASLTGWVARWEGHDVLVAQEYRRLCGTIGQMVRVTLPGDQLVAGTAIRVDDDGRLVVAEATGGVQVLSSGDVVHLRSG
jgi:BirA family biotin operon repressor/biotin-[acetyl-CoA-carboxylase] ligase